MWCTLTNALMHDMFNTYAIFKNNQHFLMLHAHIPALPNLTKLCTPLVSEVKLKNSIASCSFRITL